jgi:hypothetical protein
LHNEWKPVSASGCPVYLPANPVFRRIKTASTWGSFHYVLQIPDNIKEADVIKVYIMNESNTLIYIDDFQIVFE